VAWSVIPDAPGFSSRVVMVGIIGTIWTVIVAALVGRLLLAVMSTQERSPQVSGRIPADPVPMTRELNDLALRLGQLDAPPGHGIDPSTASSTTAGEVACRCGWSGSIPDYLTTQLPAAWRQSGPPGEPPAH
jgi:hypothetical protein